ncbi:hypothetical protein Y590_18385 [Methylobacterium sp. AMS5]|nr:hypothetical protein Y590_18385 [Methylobacterium sp. AMS5]
MHALRACALDHAAEVTSHARPIGLRNSRDHRDLFGDTVGLLQPRPRLEEAFGMVFNGSIRGGQRRGVGWCWSEPGTGVDNVLVRHGHLLVKREQTDNDRPRADALPPPDRTG